MINVDKIITIAKEKDASDIHLLCGIKPLLRIQRELIRIEEFSELTEEEMYEIYDYFIMGRVERDEECKKKRRFDMVYIFEDIRLRVNISFENEIPIFTLRLIKNKLPIYEDLGIPDIVRRMAYQPQGLILVTGKTNSGKTTTLNALVNHINENLNKKILTLENPVEFKHVSKKSIIVQKEIGKGMDAESFSDGVRNSLREDCDIIIVGEIRDKETMDAAIESAEAGHLVIGTVHTRTCAETIERCVNFYDIEEQRTVKGLLSSTLKLIVSQRLMKSTKEGLILVPEVMVVDNIVSGMIKKDKLNASELEDAIQSSSESISLINSLAKLFLEDKITLDQAKSQLEPKNIDTLNRVIMQMKVRRAGRI